MNLDWNINSDVTSSGHFNMFESFFFPFFRRPQQAAINVVHPGLFIDDVIVESKAI